MTVQDMYYVFEKATNLVKNKTDMGDYLCKRFYKRIKYLLKNNKKWMEKKVMEFINKYLHNVISCMVCVTTNINSDMKNVVLYNAIYCDT